MRISKVSVKKLFGIFDHEIQMQDSRITIIHGPNGYGKTVLLRMIHSLFNSKYKVFSEIPFAEFRVVFDNKDHITVQTKYPVGQLLLDESFEDALQSSAENGRARFNIQYWSGGGAAPETYEPKLSPEESRRFHDMIESISELDQIAGNRWLNLSTGAVMTMDDVIETYDLQSKLFSESEPKWFANIKHRLRTRFIQAQRLQSPRSSAGYSPYFRARVGRPVPSAAVERYSQEIAETIQNRLAAYGQESQVRDRSFPKRLMESGSTYLLDQNALQCKLDELENKSSELMKLGLFEDKDAPDIPKLDSTQGNLTNVLSIYVQDIETKLSMFDEISVQLKTLSDIINDRFQFKKLTIDKQKGFVFKRDGNEIPITSLSSGEQHELVLFYQLLFHVEPNSLILIDEPELSLHVSWQRNFLSDIQSITKFRDFDVLIATHSPQIVADKKSWMVKLHHPKVG